MDHGRARLEDAIAESPFAPDAVELIAGASPSIRIHMKEPDAALGASRFGGRPDLPPEFDWPRRNGKPMTFLCQLNFAEVPDGPDRTALPRDGWFVLFFDLYEEQWGFDPRHRDGWRAAYFPAGTALVRRHAPEDLQAGWDYGQRGLRFEWEWLLPQPEFAEFPDDVRDRIASDQVLAEAWRALSVDVLDSGINQHRLLGHAQPIQSDMRLTCQLVSNGLYCGDSTGYDDPRAEALRPGAEEWRLLIQIDTDDSADGVPGWMWCDCGRLYYMIRDSDLKQGGLDQGWLILQCF